MEIEIGIEIGMNFLWCMKIQNRNDFSNGNRNWMKINVTKLK
jgi:hypothetical protein